jgi:glycosyltransferase involved in cell wall biosynthesis
MNTGSPRISAITCAYNSEAFLNEAIKSILRQTLQPAEIVVIDDGSTDNTAKIAQSYANIGLRYVRQDNQGEGAARNRGIRETDGEWIAFLDADDIWADDKLQRQVEFAQSHPEIEMVGGNKLRWDVEKNMCLIVRYGQVPSQNLYKELIVNNIVGDPSIMLIRRTLFEKAGLFRTDLRIGVDWEMWLRIAKHASIGFIDAPLIIYRWHKSNVSHRYMDRYIETTENIAFDAINSYEHPIIRMELYFRVKSRSQVELTFDAMQRNISRAKQLKHALSAFLLFPFEDTGKKARLILRSLLGEQVYRALKAKFQSAEEIDEKPFGSE